MAGEEHAGSDAPGYDAPDYDAPGYDAPDYDVPDYDALDVLIVSLGSTGGLRAVDDELLASLRRAGARAAIARAHPPPPVRTMMLTDLRWARAARRVARAAIARSGPRALIYSTTTAALLWPRPGAIRFDAVAAANRPGRHGLWQRALERRRLREAPLLLPQSEGALREAPASVRRALPPDGALVLPVPVEPSGQLDLLDGVAVDPRTPGLRAQRAGAPRPVKDIAAITYAADPVKKGLADVLAAWRQVREPGEELVVAGVTGEQLVRLGLGSHGDGVRACGMLPAEDYRALLRRARVFVCAARREDHGIAQLEALADGCMLVSRASPGPYVALSIAEELDRRLIDEDLAAALRTALDDPMPRYHERALRALSPLRRAVIDRQVAEELLPRLLG
jgi:glycosyltransferase involved in cell wall biosynthesis